MRALVYTGTGEVTFREEPAPRGGDDEVVVRIDSVGICGSDMHAYQGQDPRRLPPLILGHEAAGTVVDGPGAGRRAVLNPLIAWLEQRALSDGAAAFDDLLHGRAAAPKIVLRP